MIFDFLDISAIEDGFLMIFKNACIISLIRDKSTSSFFFYSSSLRSKDNK